nr:helix-turn-helix domain-containing protein [Pedobacter sp. SYSU D00873]
MEADQLLTKKDLELFKQELFEFIRHQHQNENPAPGEWLRSKEVRTMLKISPGTLQNLRINGTIKFNKIGGAIYYSKDEITRLLSSGL